MEGRLHTAGTLFSLNLHLALVSHSFGHRLCPRLRTMHDFEGGLHVAVQCACTHSLVDTLYHRATPSADL